MSLLPTKKATFIKNWLLKKNTVLAIMNKWLSQIKQAKLCLKHSDLLD